jgi:hypothetical protein
VAGDKVVNVGAPSVTVNVPEQPQVVVSPHFTIPGLDSFNRIPDILVNFVDTVANFGNNVGVVPSMGQDTINVVVSGQLVGDGATLYAVIKNAERNFR